MDISEDEKVMREAEESLKAEIRKLRGEHGTGSKSYHSASSREPGIGGGGLGNGSTPDGGTRPALAAMSTPAPGDRAANGQGAQQGQAPAGLPTPPGLDGRIFNGVGGGHNGALPNGFNESLKSHELPALPVPGSDGVSLAFGDWLALAGPQMGDIGVNSRVWWMHIRHHVEALYERWLIATPVERLCLRPGDALMPAEFQRVEQRGVSMLLAAAPDQVKRDLVASKILPATGILFKYFTIFQPGGGLEKASLLKQVSEPKADSAQSGVLALVLGRFADALGRVGGGQVAYRISSTRQELQVDSCRPEMGTIQDYSEVLQAEAEELALSVNVKVVPGRAAAPAVKALQVSMGLDPSHLVDFGKVMKGGQACAFAHEQERGRCWNCGSPAHMKKDCPHKPKDGINQGDAKTAEKSGEPVKGEPVRDASHGQGPSGDVAAELLKEATEDILQGGSELGGDACTAYGTPRRAESPGRGSSGTGPATLFQTLLALTEIEIEPILPPHMLVTKGYRVVWKADGCRITHPTYGQVNCMMRQACPVRDVASIRD
eukprot:s1479_g1.t1